MTLNQVMKRGYSMKEKICNLFGIQYPIIQGAMAWTSLSPLVAAVSEAGGLGVLGVGFAPVEVVQSEIKKTKTLTNKPFAINVFLDDEDVLDRVTEIAIDEKVPVIYADTLEDINFDFAKKYIDQWHDAGIKCLVKIMTLKDAIVADQAGADAIIIKGWEAGGHVACESTLVLTPQVADAVQCPVIAGGGIFDGRGIAAVYALGANGIELGTAFLLADECPIHQNAKQAVINAGDMSTVITGLCTGEPSRQIANALSDKLLQIEAEHPKEEAAKLLKEICGGSLHKGMVDGDMINGAVMVGQNVNAFKCIRSTAEIIQDFIKQAQALGVIL